MQEEEKDEYGSADEPEFDFDDDSMEISVVKEGKDEVKMKKKMYIIGVKKYNIT